MTGPRGPQAPNRSHHLQRNFSADLEGEAERHVIFTSAISGKKVEGDLASSLSRFSDAVSLVRNFPPHRMTAYVVANAPASEVLAKGLHELALEYLFSLDEERLAS